MITVIISENKIEARGHAMYNPGNDIVCAAVSTICFTLADTLLRKGASFKKYKDNAKGLEVEVEPRERHKPYFEMAKIGLENIKKKYPKNIDLHIV